MNNELPTDSQQVPSKKLNGKSPKRIAVIAIAIILVIAGFYGMYKWQNDKYVSAVKSNEDINKHFTELVELHNNLKDDYQKLQEKYEKLGGESEVDLEQSQSNQEDIELSVISAARFNIAGAINTPKDGVAVKVQIKNPSKDPIYLDTNQLKLKDAQDNIYKLTKEYAKSDIPSGYVVLESQSVEAGQSINGALYYTVKDLSLKNFSLLNKSEEYQFNIQ